MLPKILQPHDEKENRSLETQLNEAKKFLLWIWVSLACYYAFFMVLMILDLFFGKEIAEYIMHFHDFVNIFSTIVMLAIIAKSFDIDIKKRR